MSKVTLNPPEPFNFACPDDWSRWKRRFEQFRVASGLDSESGAKQVSMLLYCMGARRSRNGSDFGWGQEKGKRGI